MLAEGQIAGISSEIEPRCRSHAANRHRAALSEIDLVEVDLEDAVLRITPLEDRGHDDLAHLSPPRALLAEVQVLDGLLGDGAAALHDASAPKVRECRTPYRPEVHSVVRVEPRVLRRENRLDQRVRNVGQPDDLTLFLLGAVQCGQQLRLEDQPVETAPAVVLDRDEPRAREAQPHPPGREARASQREATDEDVERRAALTKLSGARVVRIEGSVAKALEVSRHARRRDRGSRNERDGRRIDPRRKLPEPSLEP